MSPETPPQRPNKLLKTQGLELLTLATPNGVKATIYLEELKDAYGLDYTAQNIDIGTNVQKEKWFTDVGPNGRIPVLVDHDRKHSVIEGGQPVERPYSVIEGVAILEYLAKVYDPEHKFHFTDDVERFDALQWAAWAHGGVGPMQGQANHFLHFAKEKIPYGIQRYVGETERLYSVLNTRLAGRDYIAGHGRGKYSIADIATFGWINFGYFSGINLRAPEFKEVYRWWKSVNDRPAVQRGITIPKSIGNGAAEYEQRLETDAEFKEKHDARHELIRKAKEQYGYKFAPV